MKLNVNRDFHADMPNQKWLTDVTKAYLSAILDLHDNRLKLDEIGATQSMSRVSRCIDNSIEFYNTKSLQWKLRCLVPIEYRNQTMVS